MSAHTATAEHAGQHLQGYVSCYAHNDRLAAARPAPKIGDRVLVEVQIMGETFDVEAEVVHIDEDGPRGTRIIAVPEGSLATAYARYEWIAL